MGNHSRLFLACIVLFSFLSAPVWASTYTVTSTADDGSAGTLRYYINNSNSGDTITFASDLAPSGGTATIALSSALGGLNVLHDLAIEGPTAYTLDITSTAAEQPIFFIFDLSSGVSLPITNPNRGNRDNYTDFFITFTLNNIRMKNPHGTMGGAIQAIFANLDCSNCTFAENTASDSGGAVSADYGFLTFTNCVFSNNTADYLGGALSVGACDLTLSGCSFTGNGGPEAGGAIFAESCMLQLSSCTFTNNSSLFSGGAIYAADAESEFTITSCSFYENTVAFASDDTSNDRLENDSPSDIFTDGGAVTLISGSLTVDASTFRGNTCTNSSAAAGALSYGGALSVVGTLTATNCVFQQNSCSSTHFAAYGGVLSIQNDTDDSLTLKDSLFLSNSALSSTACGGAVHSNALADQTIENCSFISNSSQNNGGAVYLQTKYALQCTNTTFSNNSAASGSALYAAASNVANTLQLLFNTIIDNTAGSGSAVALASSQSTAVTLTNTLLANTNTSGQDISVPSGSSITLSGGNFIGSISGGYSDTYAGSAYASQLDITSEQLLLAPLQTLDTTPAKLQVLIPLWGSPVLDAAIPSSVTTDTRGAARPQLGAWDSGAIEATRSDIDVPVLPVWSLALFILLFLAAAANNKLPTIKA